MKILMLGWELPPYNSGGLGIACYNLCKSLSSNDIDIEFILPYKADHGLDFMTVTATADVDPKTFFSKANVYDSHQYKLGEHSYDITNIYDQRSLYEHAVAKLVEHKTFNVVHAHDWLTFKAAMRIKSTKNWPIILHVHSVESDRAGNNYGNPVVREIEFLALHMADRVIAVSEHTKKAIIRDYNIPEDKIEVVHNSIDLGSIEPLDTDNSYHYLTYMKSLGYKVVTNIGRITIQKGLTNLLYTAEKVLKYNPKTIFLIVGSGDQLNDLIELTAELKIGANVIFTDFQRGKRWRDAYGVSDLFVMPSVSEPFGLTPLEAISYGSPALVSKQSGVSEIIRNCLKVDFWDIDEMTNKICSVLDSDCLSHELWQNSYKEICQLSWEDASSKVINIYQKTTSGALA